MQICVITNQPFPQEVAKDYIESMADVYRTFKVGLESPKQENIAKGTIAF